MLDQFSGGTPRVLTPKMGDRPFHELRAIHQSYCAKGFGSLRGQNSGVIEEELKKATIPYL